MFHAFMELVAAHMFLAFVCSIVLMVITFRYARYLFLVLDNIEDSLKEHSAAYYMGGFVLMLFLVLITSLLFFAFFIILIKYPIHMM